MTQTARKSAQKRPVSAAQHVAEGVVEALDVGRLVPGQRLVEADLCLRYGVGRGPVREALQRLSNDGLVEISRNKGARIREVTLAEASGTLDVTELLLGLAARTAADRIDASGGRGRLVRALDELDAATRKDEDDDFVRARRSFYNMLLQIGGNDELLRIMPAVQIHVVRAQFRLNRAQRRLVGDFRAIGEAVLEGDAVSAETLARQHVENIRAQLKDSVKQQTGRK